MLITPFLFQAYKTSFSSTRPIRVQVASTQMYNTDWIGNLCVRSCVCVYCKRVPSKQGNKVIAESEDIRSNKPQIQDLPICVALARPFEFYRKYTANFYC